MKNIKLEYERIGLENIKNLPSDFDWKCYLNNNPDVEEAGISTEYAAMGHYIIHGSRENRLYHNTTNNSLLPDNFDYRIYRILNSDLNIFTTKIQLENHYIQHGKKEGRRYFCGMSYEQILSIKNNQQDSDLLRPSILLINHDCSLTGAPILLQDTANWLCENNFENIIFVDVVPNTLFKLNDKIKKIYHFNDENILLNIINNTISISIYSNSLTPMVKNPKLFSHVLYKTIFHFHECYSDIISYIDNYDTFKYIVDNSNNMPFVASQIVTDSNLVGIDKVKLVSPFIPDDKIKLISKYKKTPGQGIFKTDKIKIGMCGSISERKNPQLFVHLAKMNPEYQFVWIGGEIESKPQNLECIKQTNNPYEHFAELDYFFLTSIRDPCPVVILENFLMNNKVILLENNIKYSHDVSKLENVYIIRNHNNNFDTINNEFQKLPLNNEPNKTQKNVKYIENYFSTYKITDTNPYKHKSHIILSFYNKTNKDLDYYTNSINQKILFDKNIASITVSISEDDGETSKHFLRHINHDKIIINHRENSGWDLGGLMHSIPNQLYNSSDYIFYIHNKSNIIWRQELYKILYYNDYFKYDSVVSQQYYVKCDKDDRNRHLFKVHKFMNDAYSADFNYISGTCFITKYETLRNLVDNTQYILEHLTNIDTNDIYWQEQMMNKSVFEGTLKAHQNHLIYSNVDHDARDIFISTKSKNYFELLHKHNKRGIPDCAFEHALERYIGYLIYTKGNVELI
jgi:hypothetical protein